MRRFVRSRTPGQLGSPDRVPRLTSRIPVEPTELSMERAILVSVLLPGSKADPRDPLGELASLAVSAGVEVMDRIVQKRMHVSAVTLLGKGRIEELATRVHDAGANVVIFDNELLPRQIRAVEKVVNCKVIDRSELILDIFASRAKTREAQLQVELAQLQYTSPRLRGMWTHLERIAGAGGGTGAGTVGGVGTRGPGERQIEMDRRIVRDRISFLRRELESIDKRKQREVLARRDRFTISLVGYTNSGKTTLLNRLTRANQFAADLLFATLDTKTVRWELPDGHTALLSDTVGFVRDLPHHLIASFRATLEETVHADLLLHVVDASSPRAWHQMEVVDEVLAELGCEHTPRILVLNKVDIGDHASVAEILGIQGIPCVRASAKTGEGLDCLADLASQYVMGHTAAATVRIPLAEGAVLAQLDHLADVAVRTYLDDCVEIQLRMNRTQLMQLLRRYPQMRVVRGDISFPQSDSDGAE